MTKHFFGFAALLLVVTLATAQNDTLLNTTFSDGLVPTGYTLINQDGLTPDDPDLATLADSAWAVRNITKQGWTSGYAAFTVSWYKNDAGPSNDWLVLPKMTFRQGMRLSWSALAVTSSGNYRDRYQVFGANGKTYNDFGNYGPVFDTGAAGELATPQNRSLNVDSLLLLQGFKYGDSVYLAFVDITQPLVGNELAIDNILVTAPKSTAIAPGMTSAIAVSPNPATSGRISVQFSAPKAQTVSYRFVAANGAIVQTGTIRATSGVTTTTIATPAAAGLYSLVLTGETVTLSEKVVVAQ